MTRWPRGRQALVLVPGDQPDAAARGALRRALRRPPHRLAAQRPDAGAAPAQLARRAPRPRRPRARHAARGVRLAAAPRPDRGRRGTRSLVQAAGRRALLGARPGGLPRQARRRAGRARLGDAVARDLAARDAGPLCARSALSRRDRRRRAAGGAPGRHEPRAAARRRAARRWRRRWSRRCSSASPRRAEPRLPQPARLCAGAALRRLRLEERLPALQRLARLPQARPHAALPPLRPRRARAARLPGVRQPRHRADRPRHRAARGAARRAAAAAGGGRRASPASMPTARAARARSRPSSARCMPARSTCWSARRWSTKGHDFRRITLVAAVNPDTSLFSSDFRAPERLFALLMQAADAPAATPSQPARSEMWVQTWHPAHPLYQALTRHDFDGLRRKPARGTRGRRACRRSRTWRCCAPKRARRGGARLSSTPPPSARRRCPSADCGDGLPAGADERGAGRRRRAHADADRVAVARRAAASSCALAAGAAHVARANRAKHASCAGPSTSIRWRSDRSSAMPRGKAMGRSASPASYTARPSFQGLVMRTRLLVLSIAGYGVGRLREHVERTRQAGIDDRCQ